MFTTSDPRSLAAIDATFTAYMTMATLDDSNPLALEREGTPLHMLASAGRAAIAAALDVDSDSAREVWDEMLRSDVTVSRAIDYVARNA